MKKNEITINIMFIGLIFLGGCSSKEASIVLENTPQITEKSATIQGSLKPQDSDLMVEVNPIVDNKMEVVTKVKPEIAVIGTDKIDDGETPLIVVDPVEEEAPVKEVEILPVVDNTVGVVTKVQPTIEVVEEMPVDSEETAVIINPIVE